MNATNDTQLKSLGYTLGTLTVFVCCVGVCLHYLIKNMG